MFWLLERIFTASALSFIFVSKFEPNRLGAESLNSSSSSARSWILLLHTLRIRFLRILEVAATAFPKSLMASSTASAGDLGLSSFSVQPFNSRSGAATSRMRAWIFCRSLSTCFASLFPVNLDSCVLNRGSNRGHLVSARSKVGALPRVSLLDVVERGFRKDSLTSSLVCSETSSLVFLVTGSSISLSISPSSASSSDILSAQEREHEASDTLSAQEREREFVGVEDAFSFPLPELLCLCKGSCWFSRLCWISKSPD